MPDEALQRQDDRDLLIELKTVQRLMLNQITEIKEDISLRIAQLERNKLDITDSYMINYREGIEKTLRYYETRIKKNEENITKVMAYGTMLLVVLGITQFLLMYFKT